MTQIVLPNTSVTGANLWSQVEDNDQAIVDVVNGDIGADNLASSAVTTAKIADDAVTPAKLDLTVSTDTSNQATVSLDTGGATMSGGSFGLDLSLTAGTWLVLVNQDIKYSSGTQSVRTNMWNNTDGAGIGRAFFYTLTGEVGHSASAVITLTGTTTITVKNYAISGTTAITTSADLTGIRIG